MSPRSVLLVLWTAACVLLLAAVGLYVLFGVLRSCAWWVFVALLAVGTVGLVAGLRESARPGGR